MKILITGKGVSGSWKIRGEQLGCAMGAFVEPNAGNDAIAAADIVVVVKRWGDKLAEKLRNSGKPVVWDVVDAWPQPLGNSWPIEEAVDWVTQKAKEVNAVKLVYATKQMQQDVGLDGMVLYHHYRPGIRINPIREKVQVVGYEGSEKYLGIWRRRIEVECARRGWRFVVNPTQLADVDIAVAFRDEEWNGDIPIRWKSNVKLSNCQGSGTPCVMPHEHGYRETAVGGEKWAFCLTDLRTAFCQLEDCNDRLSASLRLRNGALSVVECAADYKKFLVETYEAYR